MYEMEHEKKSKLEGVLSRIEQSGKVCKQDVISVEELLGISVITEKHNINRFTDAPSAIQCDEVVSKLKHVVNNAKLSNLITMESIYRKMDTLIDRIRYVINLVGNFNSMSSENYDRLLNEKLIYSYDDNNELIDITSSGSVLSTIMTGKSYIYNAMKEVCDDPNQRFDDYGYIITDLMVDNADGRYFGDDTILSLLCLLGDYNNIRDCYNGYKNFNIKTITIRDMVQLLKDETIIRVKLSEVLVDLQEAQKSMRNVSSYGKYPIADMLKQDDSPWINEAIVKYDANLNNLISVFGDKYSIGCLKVFSLFK